MDLVWAFIVVAATIAAVLGGLGWIGYTIWKQVAAVLEEKGIRKRREIKSMPDNDDIKLSDMFGGYPARKAFVERAEASLSAILRM